MTNQSSNRTGRLRGASTIGLPESFGSVTMFMSCTFCVYLLSRIRQPFAIQMGGNCCFVQTNAAENELAKLPFEIGSVPVSQTWHRRQLRQGRHQHRVTV